MIRKCPYCRTLWDRHPWRFGVKSRRMNTAYVNYEDNFITCCPKCFEYSEERWADMWAEYYSGLI